MILNSKFTIKAMAYKIVQAFYDKAKTIRKYYVSKFDAVFNKDGKSLTEVCDDMQGEIDALGEKVDGIPGSVEVDSTLTQSGQAADAKAVGDRLKNVTGTDLSKPVEEPVEMGEPFSVGAGNVAYDEEEEYRDGSIGRKVKEMQVSIGRADAIYDDYVNAQNLM